MIRSRAATRSNACAAAARARASSSAYSTTRTRVPFWILKYSKRASCGDSAVDQTDASATTQTTHRMGRLSRQLPRGRSVELEEERRDRALRGQGVRTSRIPTKKQSEYHHLLFGSFGSVMSQPLWSVFSRAAERSPGARV